MKLYKYHGAGNDFLIGDNRNGEIRLDDQKIIGLCDRHYGIGADGVILLEESRKADFRMVFYNPDASRGMMCGNGGRCIISFAARLGYSSFNFEAPDGLHSGEILTQKDLDESGIKIPFDPEIRNRDIVKLTMSDVDMIKPYPELQSISELKCTEIPVFMNTGTRHLVIPTKGVEEIDLERTAPEIRYAKIFAPYGTNVNFIETDGPDSLFIRSYEKGVEGETYACGTGAIASAIAFRHYQKMACGNRYLTNIRTRREHLAIEFILTENGAKDIRIIGPSTFVAEIIPVQF